MDTDWFKTDKEGLAKLVDKRPKAFMVWELVQNCWDTDATKVTIELEPVEGKARAVLRVTDNHPDGFKTLEHAFTLFAESEKKGDPSKRGRFNLGEKLVLALCDEALISSTTGEILFSSEGRRRTRKYRASGSMFEGRVRMTRAELEETRTSIRQLIPPASCETYFENERLAAPALLQTFEATLPSEMCDAEGYLRPTARKTMVEVYEPRSGETPMLYEMGIPVVELDGGMRWHVNILQKVPLNADRDNVTPSYLKTIRVLLANAMQDALTEQDAKQVWVGAAIEDKRIETDALNQVLDRRFGTKRAVFDPSDPEANKQLLNEGYTIIPGGALSKNQWDNVRASGLAVPSGQIRPSGTHHGDGPPERVILPEAYTKGMGTMVAFVEDLAWRLIKKSIHVRFVNEAIALPHAAWFGHSVLTFNVGRLGKAWFEGPRSRQHLELIIHELAHDKVKDHLTLEFADEVGCLMGKALDIALTDPDFFRLHGYKAQ